MSDVLIISDERMAEHNPGMGHPERPERLTAILQELTRTNLAGVRCAMPRPSNRAAIERIHAPAYLDRIDALRGRSAELDPDTAISPASVDAAYLAAGAAIDAIDALMSGTVHRAFAFVRPPGHHAERDRAMGFCLFNNIAIAAAHAIAEHGVRRVLIVDWDVHHGNGTQHAFESRRDVLVFNVHQHRLFPDTGDLDEIGVGEGEGFTVNAPLPPGMGDEAYVALFQRLLAPIANALKPELVLVSAGFDAHRDDPLGGMKLTEDGFAALCAIVCDIADRHAAGRIGLILEGGYNLAALAASVRQCVEVLAGASPPPIGEPDAASARLIETICAFHRDRWPC